MLAKKKADLILVVNRLDRNFLIKKYSISPDKIKITANGVNYKKLADLPRQKKVYDGVFISRFHPQKGIDDLLKIWQIVCQKKPAVKLCIVGSGPEKLVRKIRKKAKGLGINKNIDFKGAKYGKEKIKLLKSSKLFVYPSLYESFAIVIAEAMASGLPVVSYNLPVYRDVYNNHLITCPIRNQKKFAEIVINLLKNKEKRDKIGKIGQGFVKKYDWEKIFEKEVKYLRAEK